MPVPDPELGPVPPPGAYFRRVHPISALFLLTRIRRFQGPAGHRSAAVPLRPAAHGIKVQRTRCCWSLRCKGDQGHELRCIPSTLTSLWKSTETEAAPQECSLQDRVTAVLYTCAMALRRQGDALAWLERFPDTRPQKRKRGRPRRTPAPPVEQGVCRSSGEGRSNGSADEGFREGLEGEGLGGADSQAWLQRFREAKAGMRRRPAAVAPPSLSAAQQPRASPDDSAAGSDGAGGPERQPEG